MTIHKCVALTLTMVLAGPIASPLGAQESAVSVQRPNAPAFLRPYEGPSVPPVRLSNSARIQSLIRGGKLYLTLQDTLALAIENNLDLEVDRYGPLLAHWALERAQAGGALRGVTSGNTQINSVTSGQGIAGSQQAAGLLANNNNNGNGGGGAVVSQIGPVTANLDAVLQNTSLYSHLTSVQPNQRQSQVLALVDTSHVYNTTLQQGLLSGGYVQVFQNDSYLKENTPTDVLNPSQAFRGGISIRHNFLSAFGVGVNSRFIRVAEANVGASRETFRSQLLDLAAGVLNDYWSLVADVDSLKARQRALETAEKFYNDTKTEIDIGAVAKVDIYRAQAEVATRTQELSIARVQEAQQETLLKESISRNGISDPVLESAQIIPLDSIQVPEKDDLPPLRELLKTALAKRPDVSAARVRFANAKISALGTASGILPQLTGFAQTYNRGLTGTAQNVSGETADPYFVGGLGNAVGQVARRNFPNETAYVLFSATLKNRIAQSDYGIDQLQLRQTEVSTERQMNQILVDISNQTVALRQTHARYTAALDTRKLQEQLLDIEQRKFSLGTATFASLIGVQRSLVNAQTNEGIALGAYAHARVGLEQSLGETLERNNISVDEVLAGRGMSKPPG